MNVRQPSDDIGLSMPASSTAEITREPRQPRLIPSDELFAGETEIVILHHGSPYRLRITRQDKLILTK